MMLDAVILAGGRGSRLGGLDKATLRIDGERLVDRAAAAARGNGAGRIVVVGPEHTRAPGSLVVREDPPLSGPLAALATALPHLDATWTLLLSCDLEHPDAVCALLAEQLAEHLAPTPDPEPAVSIPQDGWVLVDDDGYPQWLAGLYRTAALRRGVEQLGDDGDGADADSRLTHLADLPLRALFRAGDLRLTKIPAPGSRTADIDRPEDLTRARAIPDSQPDPDPEGDQTP
ncbi:molybdenum cofactor guanylyltransferase [Citricoccus muralis]|uniref:NTP transferase domain-containing protein n=1 Tax=Citricoccus muralis TaxID=169134 RepID=A0ABY8H6X6_9MICC|nr:NTP transferase domain-containing protein [Citricoccus muralis]WFP16676.1 NTP transferase domain-containing protein [Citricoccus muralis]